MIDSKTLKVWQHHLQDETDAAYLYNILSDSEENEKKRIFTNNFPKLKKNINPSGLIFYQKTM